MKEEKSFFKKIAVILPVFNGGEFLSDSVKSVLEQENNDYEFIACDDASTDLSLAKLLELKSLFPENFTVISNAKNEGLFRTLNKLICSSKAPLIHLWSQDDIMKPNCLTECIKFHENHDNISMSYHDTEYIDEKGEIIPNDKQDGTPTIITTSRYANISVRWGCIAGNIANVTLKRSYLNKAGLFNEDLVVSGDFELWTRLASISNIGRNPEKLIYLRRHAGQFSRNYKSIFQRIQEDIAIHKKIIGLLPNKEQKIALRWWRWKTLTSYFNDLLFLLLRKEYVEFSKLLKLLKGKNNIFKISMRWFLIRIMRLIKLDIYFYKKVLDR